jgi:hypothetical protein
LTNDDRYAFVSLVKKTGVIFLLVPMLMASAFSCAHDHEHNHLAESGIEVHCAACEVAHGRCETECEPSDPVLNTSAGPVLAPPVFHSVPAVLSRRSPNVPDSRPLRPNEILACLKTIQLLI